MTSSSLSSTMNRQQAEGEMNRNQKHAAAEADADTAQPAVAGGVIVAQAELVIGNQRFHRGQVIGPASMMETWAPANKAALLGNKLIEQRAG
jgi:hypothetical protein